MMNSKRGSGVLLHISSLPGAYGIGDFGKGAYEFIDFLHEGGFHYWQVLPFTRTDECNSPYKSDSAFAGNAYFIDIKQLAEMGLLTGEELSENEHFPDYAADYEWLAETRPALLKKAYQRADDDLKKRCLAFAEQQQDWLPDYALYRFIKEQSGKDWIDWSDSALKNHEPFAVHTAMERYKEDLEYYYFEQYIFFTQWMAVKRYANEKEVAVIGDMPIYLSYESSDVWANREWFELDEQGFPCQVAGVPPDYFSADGQKWGNPLYRWDTMKNDRYHWWKQRLKHTLRLFDKVRIDHFRAFSAYWAVPFDAETAKDGKWIPGVGMDFFDEIFKEIDRDAIIAEDLGIQDEALTRLLKDSGLPGMRVLQFGFLGQDDDMHLPHNYSYNTVAYSGTHDNTTLLAHLWELTPEQRNYCLTYCGFEGNDWQSGGAHNPANRAVLKTLWKSHAKLVISPIQDLCGFGGDTTMNRPGTTENNWRFRLTPEAFHSIDVPYLRQLNELYKRN